jgi:DNA-binding NarL/FixJ family response regulator
VVLMDIRMPRLDGVEATKRIAADDRLEGVRVLILTTFESDEYVFEALRVGASGFLVKDSAPTDILTAVRVLASGEALLSPSVTRRLIEEYAAWPERLVVSPATAKTHVSRSMMKLHAHDRAQLVVLAYQTGLVIPGEPVEPPAAA